MIITFEIAPKCSSEHVIININGFLLSSSSRYVNNHNNVIIIVVDFDIFFVEKIDAKILTTRDRADLVFENGKIAFFDFDDEHYFSSIRSRRWNIQGVRGEIQNDVVCYMNENNQPVTERMYREDDGVNNIDGWSHSYISFKGERIYENPFPGLRINDDEIAVTSLLVGMKNYLETGTDIYSLRDGLQDAYLDFMREEAVSSGKVIQTTNQSWV